MIRRFGNVVAGNVGPGLHYRVPWPVDRVDLVAVEALRRVETPASLMLTGDAAQEFYRFLRTLQSYETFVDEQTTLILPSDSELLKYLNFTGWWQVDPILAVLIGLWVLPRTWKLLSESVNILLEGVPAGVELQKLYNALAALPGVREVHDLHVWAITSGQNSMTVHLVTETPASSLALVGAAHRVARDHGIEHASIQVEEPDTIEQEHDVHGRLDG